MFNHAGSPTLSNVLFSGNYAYNGAGLYTDGGNPSLINVTFSGNRSDHNAIMQIADGTPTLVNTIFWGNNNTIGGPATATSSIVQGGYTGYGNLDVDPLFVDERSYGEAPTTAGDYRLQYNSPVIEVGNITPVTALSDLDENPRLVDSNGDAASIVDMGAYEWQAYALTVNIDGGPGVVRCFLCNPVISPLSSTPTNKCSPRWFARQIIASNISSSESGPRSFLNSNVRDSPSLFFDYENYFGSGTSIGDRPIR